MIKIGLVGYSGRVGGLIREVLKEKEEFVLSCIYKHQESRAEILKEVLATNHWQEFFNHCDVVIDFSNPNGTLALLQEALKFPKPLVIGTTGLEEQALKLLQEASCKMPIVYASNTSRGVTLLEELASLVTKALSDADIEICEMHHKHKKDSPSGTALSLANACAKARGVDLESVRVSGRDGNIGARKKGEIGVMSLRGGDIVGRHSVGFYCDGEYLELTHNATDRKTFAIGALEAAKWVASQKNGLYHMKDVLGQ